MPGRNTIIVFTVAKIPKVAGQLRSYSERVRQGSPGHCTSGVGVIRSM